MTVYEGRFKLGTAIVLKNTGGDAVLTLTSLATVSYRQGAKFDLGANPEEMYVVRLKTAFAVAPTAGGALQVWIAGSPHATAANENPAGLSGADAAYTGYNANAAASAAQLHQSFVGQIATVALTDGQLADVGIFRPLHRYAIPLFYNGGSQALSSTAADHEIALYPLIPIIEPAA